MREIGEAAGGMDYGVVSMMLKRFEKRMRNLTKAEEMLNIKMRALNCNQIALLRKGNPVAPP